MTSHLLLERLTSNAFVSACQNPLDEHRLLGMMKNSSRSSQIRLLADLAKASLDENALEKQPELKNRDSQSESLENLFNRLKEQLRLLASEELESNGVKARLELPVE